jgi:hypothetical protein
MKMRNEVQIGDKIHIIEMIGEPEYANIEGIVEYIWDNMILGTWGNKPLVYTDNFIIINQIKEIKNK